MPRIESIQIKNFKGASDVTIALTGRVPVPVVTLIGLNESGKTTILEGLSSFVSKDSAVSEIFEGVHTPSAISSLIPINKKAAFNGVISIVAKAYLDDEDVAAAFEVARSSFDVSIDPKTIERNLSISQEYQFVDSELKTSRRIWGLKFQGKLKGKRKPALIYGGEAAESVERKVWLKVTESLAQRLPRISYFPTFLVDTPARIYLEEHDDERAVNRYYRSVLQDVLTSVAGQEISLEKHVCKRIRDFKTVQNQPAWMSLLLGSPTKSQIDSVFQKISNAVTKEVLGGWAKVFQRPINAKLVSMEWNIDPQRGDLPYASFFISDGESKYAVSERSLGFKWFFSFLLFTAFKKGADRPTLFLFDEPAANLHAKAQAELLKSFSRITTEGNQIVYSTHSHHMINPRWLSGAYIVENTAVDVDADDAFGLSTKPTNVVATPYRQFVSQYPERTSYFQPVLDQLQYVPPAIVGEPPYLVVEGISDFHAFKIVQGAKSPIGIIPGAGAGALDPIISSLLGRGVRFLILLDDDAAGRKAAERYRRNWFLGVDVVTTLAGLDRKQTGKRLEGLVSETAKLNIAKAIGKPAAATKKEVALYLAELFASDRKEGLDELTTANLSGVLAVAERLLTEPS